jgi:uncharacterized protein (DUF2235 family)
MAGTSRNLIVLSDGTGNSASKAFKTNVWRLYQALDLRDGKQVAVFGDGVGTSSVTFLRIVGLALGVGVKRNVLNLYKFLCHNYWREKRADGQTESDRIWMFGFSRGAFTIRVLAGLVHSEGLVKFETEADLERNAIAAYRAFREKAFPAKARWVFWVPLGRRVRDLLISWWQPVTGGVAYELVDRRKDIDIHFVGLWDTVAAYGLPIDELTIAVDKWVWPMKFEDTSLLDSVLHARHALALDDERRTFHPIPWDERAEKQQRGRVDPDRLTQVWFPGMHADVGGGYPDDGLSFVPLCWMIDEAAEKGLKFEELIVETYRSLASPTGRIYDSRGGTGALWRYQPRNVQFLMDKNDDTVPKPDRVTPLVHHCVVTRMTYGNDGYAPKSLPFKIDILLPDRVRVGFDQSEVDAAMQTATDASTKTVLANLEALIDTAQAQDKRGYTFALVLDTIWWRRFVYFVTLGLALVALAFPAVYALMNWGDKTEKINQIESGAVTYLLTLFKGFIPGYASPWVDAVAANPPLAVNIVLLFIISLVVSSFLQLRIQDRARAAWNVQPKVGDKKIDRLRLAGQRHAFATAAVVLAIVAGVYLSHGDWKSFLAAATGAVLSALVVFLRNKKPKIVDPANPPLALKTARWLRNSSTAVSLYRWVARTGFPAFFILIVAWLAVSGLNLALYVMRSTDGAFCEADPGDKSKSEEERKKEAQQHALNDRTGSATVDISSPCARTRLWLVAGRQYRIRIEPGVGETAPGIFEKKPEYAWFDKGTPADVGGFGANSGAHFAGMTLKRWWWENYFQPIARVGNIGNYEYPLHPAAPLPKVDFSACMKADAPQDIESPAPLPERLKVLACEKDNNIQRNEVLIADITPDSTGELYIYVNDAILFWDSRDHHKFYKNNSGKAKITVTRTVAPATVDFNSAEGSQPQQRN